MTLRPYGVTSHEFFKLSIFWFFFFSGTYSLSSVTTDWKDDTPQKKGCTFRTTQIWKYSYLLRTYLYGYLFWCTARNSDIVQMCISCQCISLVSCETNDTKTSQIAFRNHFVTDLDLWDHLFLKVILKALDKMQYYQKVTCSCLWCWCKCRL
jgi:hypothetical protein